MISCYLQGGLGNQLFQIFATISLSIDEDKQFIFSNQKNTLDRKTYWSNFLISLSDRLIESNDSNHLVKLLNLRNKYIEHNFHYKKILNKEVNFLFGYFQSYKYFENNFSSICNLINLDINKQNIKEKYLNNEKLDNFVSLHFRMGDYKNLLDNHPILPIKYYEKSIEYIMTQAYSQMNNLTFLYFCEKEDNDYINTIIISLQQKYQLCTFIKANDDIEDWEQMLMMSNCHHNIIANSSFSWWGAYFNSNPDKIVCYPSIWFGSNLSHHNTSDMCPNNWKVININDINCIFICVFNNKKYINLLYLLLESIYIYGNFNGTKTEILIYTSTEFMNIIKQSNLYCVKIKFEINDNYHNIDTACKSRLDLFNLQSISNYSKFLYLDTDILIKGDLNKIFNVCKEDILYVLEEGILAHNIENNSYYGSITLFGDEINNYSDKTAFTSGILLFNNCKKIQKLFEAINKDIITRPYIFGCYDQPYIVYNAFKYNLYDNKLLKAYAVNNDYNINSNMIIHHFPGGPGFYNNKIIPMTNFLNNIKLYSYPNRKIIYDTYIAPNKNTIFPIVAICISYNYFDTLQFTLPVNYLHFDKFYLITQEDDVQTIEFCKKFNNVKVLLYNFKNNNFKFDKYGAIKYGQEIMYEQYPNHWYLNIDSDILLPNNFIHILLNEKLNPECIYGAIRNNVNKTSELLNKKINSQENIKWIYNNILYIPNVPPSILGCFQLYKKQCYQYLIDNADGFGDYKFGHDNFNLFCNLENIVYFHLGPTGKNWSGKVEEFIHDIKLPLEQIYYNYQHKCHNIYYDKNCQIVNKISEKTLNIYNDIWTCSDEMRNDIADFFKDKSNLKIAEIGSHKGYSTKILSNLFSKVYAVDNSIEYTDININYNKDIINIEYVILDIYKNKWDILPDDIDISFIDADHNYSGCKSDIINSIDRFKNLKYIIFDDYGVWAGVKQICDELMYNKTLLFEKFIGLTNIPGPDDEIVTNSNEGIICRVNKRIIEIENKKYSWGDLSIIFLENFKMIAFGDGYYTYIDSKSIIAFFGGRNHKLTFNNDYSEFISVRDDSETIHGAIINNIVEIENKKYSWGDLNITFLENFKMSAFGDGYYTYIDFKNIIAFFGGRQHKIVFNLNYSEFISVRDDSEVICGYIMV